MKKIRIVHGFILLCMLAAGFSLLLSGCAVPSQDTAPTPQVAAPTFYPPAAAYASAQLVSISCTTADAVMRYTTDGSAPTTTVGTIYSGAISVGVSETITVIGYKPGLTNSSVVTAVYSISGSVAAPTFSPVGGTYANPQSVTVSTLTPGTTIRFTTDGSMPSQTLGTVYSTPVIVATGQTISAIAYRSGWLDSTVSSTVYSLQAATPAFSLAAGTYSSDQSVAITSATIGAAIHYTTDGSPPTVASPVYSTPISVAGSGTSKTIKALALMTGMTDSLAASAAFTINYSQVSTPNFSPLGGTYTSDQSVTITTATTGAIIHYTTDGSTPSASSPVYGAAISIAGNGTTTTIKTYAVKVGMTDSSTGAATYVIGYLQVSSPAFSPLGGTYTSDQSVTITTATSGAVIHYTTDGSTPSASSPVYGAAISMAGNGTTTTIKAIAVKTGMTNSSMAAATYVIGYLQVSGPVFSPPGGTYASDQSVTITTATGGATIHYTIDGSAPTAVSPAYSAPILVAGNGVTETIRAIAVNAGMTDSATAAATWVIFDTWQTIGSQGTGVSQFHIPRDVDVDAGGHIYVADTSNNRIVRMDDMAGTNWTPWGSLGSGSGQFNNPSGVVVDTSGRIYVADTSNNRIVRMDDMAGTNWTPLGSFGSGSSQFKAPTGIAVDAGGHVYVADTGNNRIIRMDDMAGTNWTPLGSYGSGSSQFVAPAGLVTDAGGHVYVADTGNNRIVRMDDMTGTNWAPLGSYGSGSSQFIAPMGIAVDASGHIYVADMGNNGIVRMDDIGGTNWTLLGSYGGGIIQFISPTGIAVDTGGYVYSTDQDSRVARFRFP